MQTGSLKRYAPEARKAFIRAVSRRAGKFGISKGSIEPVTVQGDVVLIKGQAFPKRVADDRNTADMGEVDVDHDVAERVIGDRKVANLDRLIGTALEADIGGAG